MFSLDTPRGRIHLEELHQRRTYAGLAEGYPNERLNASILARMPRAIERVFGGPSIHVIPPRVTFREARSERGPPWVEMPKASTPKRVPVAGNRKGPGSGGVGTVGTKGWRTSNRTSVTRVTPVWSG